MKCGCLYKKEYSKLKYVPSIGERRGVVKTYSLFACTCWGKKNFVINKGLVLLARDD